MGQEGKASERLVKGGPAKMAPSRAALNKFSMTSQGPRPKTATRNAQRVMQNRDQALWVRGFFFFPLRDWVGSSQDVAPGGKVDQPAAPDVGPKRLRSDAPTSSFWPWVLREKAAHPDAVATSIA